MYVCLTYALETRRLVKESRYCSQRNDLRWRRQPCSGLVRSLPLTMDCSAKRIVPLMAPVSNIPTVLAEFFSKF